MKTLLVVQLEYRNETEENFASCFFPTNVLELKAHGKISYVIRNIFQTHAHLIAFIICRLKQE